ncbi:hypothetical protein BESB_036670 [Besnoitia besnoiti]|uniref:Lysine decarboxylase family protein n=1 Tax=Besnoitia besnoiti TaxID=94643 RepID=A0A2A9MH29_BESBE|nr:hypothetical protein BESB_036670 [Besnoitia besnoiti]PFH37209.1 hypothetical protein BESB_036670 [Besnoitia besnoiti]
MNAGKAQGGETAGARAATGVADGYRNELSEKQVSNGQRDETAATPTTGRKGEEDEVLRKAVKSYNNEDWLHSRSAREVRILCEYLEVEDRLRRQKVLCTFLLFGSARARSPDQWKKLMEAAQERLKDPATRADAQKEIAKLKRSEWMCTYWVKIRNLSRMLMQWLQTEEARQVSPGGEDGHIGRAAFFKGLRRLQIETDVPIRGRTRAYRVEIVSPCCGMKAFPHTLGGDVEGLSGLLGAWRSARMHHCRALWLSLRLRPLESQAVARLLRELPAPVGGSGHHYTAADVSPVTDLSEPCPVAICTGGGPGMMEAGNCGASEAGGGRSMGMGVSLPFEKGLNAFVDEGLAFEFHYFFTRKFWMVYSALGVIAAPGGLGTLDELMEVLTLKQSGKMKRDIPIVLFGKQFWKDIVSFDKLVEYGVATEKDRDQLFYTDDENEAFDYLKQFLLDDKLVLGNQYVHKSLRHVTPNAFSPGGSGGRGSDYSEAI